MKNKKIKKRSNINTSHSLMLQTGNKTNLLKIYNTNKTNLLKTYSLQSKKENTVSVSAQINEALDIRKRLERTKREYFR